MEQGPVHRKASSTHTGQQNTQKRTRTCIDVQSGVRIRDPGVRVVKDLRGLLCTLSSEYCFLFLLVH